MGATGFQSYPYTSSTSMSLTLDLHSSCADCSNPILDSDQGDQTGSQQWSLMLFDWPDPRDCSQCCLIELRSIRTSACAAAEVSNLRWLCIVHCRHFPVLLPNSEKKDTHRRFMPTLSSTCVCPQKWPYLVCEVLNLMTNPMSSSFPISNCGVQWGSRREIWEENGKINFISYNHRK